MKWELAWDTTQKQQPAIIDNESLVFISDVKNNTFNSSLVGTTVTIPKTENLVNTISDQLQSNMLTFNPMQSELSVGQYSPVSSPGKIITWPITYSAITNSVLATAEVPNVYDTTSRPHVVQKSYSDIYFSYLSELLGSSVQPDLSTVWLQKVFPKKSDQISNSLSSYGILDHKLTYPLSRQLKVFLILTESDEIIRTKYDIQHEDDVTNDLDESF